MRTWLTCLALVLCSGCYADEQDSVHWLVVDSPPLFVVQDGTLTGGAIGTLLLHLVAQVPQRHVIEVSNNNRGFNDIRQGKPRCAGGLVKNVLRESLIHFSLPVLPFLPNGLVYATANSALVERHHHDGQVNARALLMEPKLRIGLIAGRSNGELLDVLLNHTAMKSRLMAFTKTNDAEKLLHMVSLQRLDIAIVNPTEVGFMQKQGQLEENLHFLPLMAQSAEQYLYFGCTKGEWGAQQIARINPYLKNRALLAEAAAIYAEYLPQPLVAFYRQRTRTFLANSAP